MGFSKGLLAELDNEIDFYLIFFSSGILAALDSQGKGLDINSGLDRVFNYIKPIPNQFSHTYLSQIWDHSAKKISNFATPFVSTFVRYMGASAGIYGVIGATLVSEIITLFQIIFLKTHYS